MRYARYAYMDILSEHNNYELNIGSYTGNAGDSLSYHNGRQFGTFDHGNRGTTYNCIDSHGYGGFRFDSCIRVGVNNYYSDSSAGYGYNGNDKIRWDAWHGAGYSLKSTRMMIRLID